MVLSLAASVYASVTTDHADHEFDGGFALQLLVADVLVAAALSPSIPA